MRVGDRVRYCINPGMYIPGIVVEVCDDDTVWVEHNGSLRRRYDKEEIFVVEKLSCADCSCINIQQPCEACRGKWAKSKDGGRGNNE